MTSRDKPPNPTAKTVSEHSDDHGAEVLSLGNHCRSGVGQPRGDRPGGSECNHSRKSEHHLHQEVGCSCPSEHGGHSHTHHGHDTCHHLSPVPHYGVRTQCQHVHGHMCTCQDSHGHTGCHCAHGPHTTHNSQIASTPCMHGATRPSVTEHGPCSHRSTNTTPHKHLEAPTGDNARNTPSKVPPKQQKKKKKTEHIVMPRGVTNQHQNNAKGNGTGTDIPKSGITNIFIISGNTVDHSRSVHQVNNTLTNNAAHIHGAQIFNENYHHTAGKPSSRESPHDSHKPPRADHASNAVSLRHTRGKGDSTKAMLDPDSGVKGMQIVRRGGKSITGSLKGVKLLESSP